MHFVSMLMTAVKYVTSQAAVRVLASLTTGLSEQSHLQVNQNKSPATTVYSRFLGFRPFLERKNCRRNIGG